MRFPSKPRDRKPKFELSRPRLHTIVREQTTYDVGSPQVVPSEEEFGIFGCRFYGMKVKRAGLRGLSETVSSTVS